MSMSTYTTDKASPFTRAVICSMRKLYVDFSCGFFGGILGLEGMLMGFVYAQVS